MGGFSGRVQRVMTTPAPDSLMPTGALAEAFPRVGSVTANGAPLSTGRLTLTAFHLPAQLTVTSILAGAATCES
jgi:hypothetical protein